MRLLVLAVLMREITVTRGFDPCDCVLFCFGGAGALFALDLARELEMSTVYVPPAASVFSAVGATLSRVAYETSTGMYARVESLAVDSLTVAVRDVAARALALLAADGLPLELRLEVDLKYRVQPETLEPRTMVDASASVRRARSVPSAAGNRRLLGDARADHGDYALECLAVRLAHIGEQLGKAA